MDGRSLPAKANQDDALDTNTKWLKSIKDRASTSFDRKPPPKPTIFRVPPCIRSGNSSAFTPKLVSIGPYHRRKFEDSKAMEELKWRLLYHYFSKVPNDRQNHVLREMKDLEKQARHCYSEAIDLSSDEFVEMLLLDGCFLVQIFITMDDPEALKMEELNSLLFDNVWFLPTIIQDLLLLENQLPYFIVEHLLDTVSITEWDGLRLQNVAIALFSTILPHHSNAPQPEPLKQSFELVDHLLHLSHKWISSIPKKEVVPYSRNSSLSKKFQVTIPNITELVEAGIKIKAREAKSFLDISFCKDKGELEIPPISIGDFTHIGLANLVALEQCCCIHGMDVTHYIMFFDNITNTSKDAELLYQEGIVDRLVGDNEEIVSLFKKLDTNVVCETEASYLKNVYKDLRAYCESRWPRWRAKAMHDYFNNPWAIISLGAAVLLLGLTILQSVYSVLGYNKM